MRASDACEGLLSKALPLWFLRGPFLRPRSSVHRRFVQSSFKIVVTVVQVCPDHAHPIQPTSRCRGMLFFAFGTALFARADLCSRRENIRRRHFLGIYIAPNTA